MMVVMVMMWVVMMMVVMVVVMVMLHRRGGRGLLRDGVASQANGESGGGDKALDHGQSILR
jgi:preprotein translocase subunit SecG